MKMLLWDTETTGLPDMKAPAHAPGQPHIVELGALLIDVPSAKVEAKLHSIVRPVGYEIPADSTAIHGISHEQAMASGEHPGVVWGAFDELLERAQVIAGFNLAFDYKMIRGEFRRAGMRDWYGKHLMFDVMPHARRLCKIAPSSKMAAAGYLVSKQPTLAEALFILCDKRIQGAHSALADAYATYTIWRDHLRSEPFKPAPVARGPRDEADIASDAPRGTVMVPTGQDGPAPAPVAAKAAAKPVRPATITPAEDVDLF